MKIRTRAFTLIELLVVIAIVGVLSSIVLTNLNGSRQKARDVKRVADVKQLQLALALYFDANNGKYPVVLSTLAPIYIPAIPTPPSGVTDAAANYVYVPIDSGGGSCNNYHLGTSLEVAGNSILTSDSDAAVAAAGVPATGCLGGGTVAAADFNGLNQTHCTSGTAGTAQPGGTEVCFDVTP